MKKNERDKRIIDSAENFVGGFEDASSPQETPILHDQGAESEPESALKDDASPLFLDESYESDADSEEPTGAKKDAAVGELLFDSEDLPGAPTQEREKAPNKTGTARMTKAYRNRETSAVVKPDAPEVREIAPTEGKVLPDESPASAAPDTKPEIKQKKSGSSYGLFDAVRHVLLFVCFTVFLYCSYTLISSLLERAQSRQLYDDMRSIFYDDAGMEDSYLAQSNQNVPSVDLLSAFVGVEPPEPVINVPTGSKLIDKVNYLVGLNADTVGWITVEGTNIDYPVVHSADNDFYLRRDFNGKSNLSGTLFTDSRNSKKLMENRNTVIYGHNMNDGSMFNNLHDFKNRSVFDNSSIQMVTPNGIFVYEVFSVHEALDTSEYFQTDFENDEHFASYLKDMLDQSIFKKEGLTLSPADKVITLSTCVDPVLQSEYRWAVHGKLVQVIDYVP